jgi:hypothetical protein
MGSSISGAVFARETDGSHNKDYATDIVVHFSLA